MSQNALAVQQATALASVDDMFSDARIALIRDSVAKGAPPDVFAAMIDIAKRRNLDPLAKQIICARFGDTWQLIVTIDGYRAIAEQTGQYAGSDAPIFTFEEDTFTHSGKRAPTTATVTVYKLLGGMRHPFSETVYWEEYAGKNNWNTMPKTMLAKVAESHALRKAFPSVLSGTYTREEMDQAGPYVDAETGEVHGEPVEAEGRTFGRGEPPRVLNADQAISERQVSLIQALRRDARMSVQELDQLALEHTGKVFAECTRGDASKIIDALKERLANAERPQATGPQSLDEAITELTAQPVPAQERQITPARQEAIKDFRRARDLAVFDIDAEKAENAWLRYKGVAYIEDVAAGTLTRWAEAIRANPKGFHDTVQDLIAQQAADDEALVPSVEELGR